jgi:hypothetical protein
MEIDESLVASSTEEEEEEEEGEKDGEEAMARQGVCLQLP